MEEIAKELPNLFDKFLESAAIFLIKVVIAIIVFYIGKKIIQRLMRLLNNLFERSKVEPSVSKFLVSLLKTAAYVLLLIAILDSVGVKATSLAALVGSAGLTLGLALQGSLSNFSGGVLILLLKPFRIGDYIIANGYEGTVDTIDIFYTKLLTIDNRMVVLPNGELSNSNITNVTNETIRRLDLTVSIEYSQDIQEVKEILVGIAKSEEMVLENYDINVFVDNFDPSSIRMGMRVWCKTEDYWILRWDMLEKIKTSFDEKGIVIPFDQLDVNLKEHITTK